MRDIVKKLPKLRGYRFHSFREKPVAVTLERIVAAFPSGATVDPAALLATGIIHKIKGTIPLVKVVGDASVNKRLTVKGMRVSRPAAARITAAGGSVVAG